MGLVVPLTKTSSDSPCPAADLNQSCRQRDRVPVFAFIDWRSITSCACPCSSRRTQFASRFYQRNDTAGIRSLLKLRLRCLEAFSGMNHSCEEAQDRGAACDWV